MTTKVVLMKFPRPALAKKVRMIFIIMAFRQLVTSLSVRSRSASRRHYFRRGVLPKLPTPASISHGQLAVTATSHKNAGVTALFSTSQNDGISGETVMFRNIGRAEMEELLAHYEDVGRDASQMVVIDVRTELEVQATGKLSPSVETLPVQVILQRNAFALDDEDFEELCGFAKPKPDETIVFSCAAGIRSVYASQAASMAGFSSIVNYMGGSSEWFSNR